MSVLFRRNLLYTVLILGILANTVWAFIRFGGIEYVTNHLRPPKDPLCPDCHIVLVTLDVCGAHNMSCYGYRRETSPNFCSYAQDSIFFENAYANGVYTLPSHASIFTGLIPSAHGVNRPYVDGLTPDKPLLSDELHKKGYETLFFMPDKDIQLPVELMYQRGMTAIYPNDALSEQSLDTAMNRLMENDKEGKKTFISYYSSRCHEPYYLGDQKPKYVAGAYPGLPQKQDDIFWQFTEDFWRYLLRVLPIDMNTDTSATKSAALKDLYKKLVSAQTFQEAKLQYEQAVHDQAEDHIGYYNYDFFYTKKIDTNNKEQMAYLRGLYDQKLSETDQLVVGKLRKYINSSPLKDNTIVVITSEHGQEFGEHDIFGHTTLYDLNTKVPLLLSVPNIMKRRVAQNVQSVDIMPTLLALVGVPASSVFDGVSLVPFLRGKKLPERTLIADGGFWDNPSKQTLRYGEWKVFVTRNGDKIVPYELYNIKTDPFETKNVLASHFAIAKQIITRYQRTKGNK